jgi:hypothetical protein
MRSALEFSMRDRVPPANDRHGAQGMANNAVGDTAEQQPMIPFATMRTENDGVCWPRGGHFQK